MFNRISVMGAPCAPGYGSPALHGIQNMLHQSIFNGACFSIIFSDNSEAADEDFSQAVGVINVTATEGLLNQNEFSSSGPGIDLGTFPGMFLGAFEDDFNLPDYDDFTVSLSPNAKYSGGAYEEFSRNKCSYGEFEEFKDSNLVLKAKYDSDTYLFDDYNVAEVLVPFIDVFGIDYVVAENTELVIYMDIHYCVHNGITITYEKTESGKYLPREIVSFMGYSAEYEAVFNLAGHEIIVDFEATYVGEKLDEEIDDVKELKIGDTHRSKSTQTRYVDADVSGKIDGKSFNMVNSERESETKAMNFSRTTYEYDVIETQSDIDGYYEDVPEKSVNDPFSPSFAAEFQSFYGIAPSTDFSSIKSTFNDVKSESEIDDDDDDDGIDFVTVGLGAGVVVLAAIVVLLVIRRP